METKRFIGNDMPRIYARVKREFGPDAVIVRTRSLLRDGAEPLIEVLAAPPEAEAELTFELQKALVDGAMQRATTAGSGVTVGELEDLVTRERQLDETKQTRSYPVPVAQGAEEEIGRPEWLSGFVANAPEAPAARFAPAPLAPAEEIAEENGSALAELLAALERVREMDATSDSEAAVRRLPSLPDIPVIPAPENDWASRPRPAIVTRPRRIEPVVTEEPAATHQRDPFVVRPAVERDAGVADALRAAGMTARAARTVEISAAPGMTAETALAKLLDSREVTYPEENRTAIISIQGAAGSGRTTALMRMALDCADSGRHTILLAADGSHVAGRQQVHAYAEAIGLTAVDAFDPGEIVRTAGQAPRGSCLFVDAPAGAWQAPPMPGVSHFQYLAVPAHWQADAVEGALSGMSLAGFAGAVLTFADVATNLSPAISRVVESQLGVAFLSSSRDVGTGIEVADPVALASGIFTTRTRESTDGRIAATA